VLDQPSQAPLFAESRGVRDGEMLRGRSLVRGLLVGSVAGPRRNECCGDEEEAAGGEGVLEPAGHRRSACHVGCEQVPGMASGYCGEDGKAERAAELGRRAAQSGGDSGLVRGHASVGGGL
jgi:hypothetical protein